MRRFKSGAYTIVREHFEAVHNTAIGQNIWFEIICNDYNRMFLRYLGKLNRLLHEERIDQSEYDDLKKTLLKASESINNVPRTIQDLK